jgi:hypothetical protein
MANMGRYCKAYPAARFREFGGWVENTANRRSSDAQSDKLESPESAGEDYYFLQETFVVTDGIFLDENVIFDAVTPEWKTFCSDVLKFEIPDFDAEETSVPVSAAG